MRFFILSLLALTAVPALAQTPTIPTNVQATATSGNAVTVTWTASTGGAGITYRVFRNNTQTGTDTSSTTFSDSSLTPGTTYQYSVSAINSVGASARSANVSVTTPTTPGVPTGLSGTAGTDGVVLRWNSVSGATEYVIFRNGTEIDTSTTTTYTDTETDFATTYRYSVASSNSSGDSSRSAEVAVTTRGDGTYRTAYWTRVFEEADGDFDGIVTFEEYLVSHPVTKRPEVFMLHRYRSIDDDESGDLTVDEYIEHFAGKKVKRPSKVQTFTLADVYSEIGDGDGYLDPYEFALTMNRGTKESQVMKKFNKLDKNGSGYLSEVEFGIRYGKAEAATEIISSLTASGNPGEPFTYEIIGTKNPTSYGATNLPPGLTLDPVTGIISGTPTTIGMWGVAISATDDMGTNTATLTVRIGVPTITSVATASATTATAFSYQIVATQTPSNYSATNLPAGITLDTATGLISGTATVTGTFNVVLGATNAAGTGSKTLVLTVTTVPPAITSTLTATGTVGTAFSYQITATPAATSYTAVGLPSGLTISATTGLISGTPVSVSTTSVTITATNAAGTDSETLVITISAAG
ncbi:putative Ig domain-containing protein [Luteolibacter flavescens]|uniref:Ig domain-containing protein n=1 Tax=Luteolibacter flavescens TaxID=1859460 RepID=A0ABT3FME6_9BACT|nr:putative Ig domain-containing protein [Luteolibacter flavescens]MCW1884745.1 putative Ig domain-containing protein [Luteolibacter flavescens]